MTGEVQGNPYRDAPEVMRAALGDPTVNASEHELYFPRLQALMPNPGTWVGRNRVRRVLDFGCGAGNFTAMLAAQYPSASVIGADAVPQMLPAESKLANLSFIEWDGMRPLPMPSFDLIVAKMVLHYLSPTELRTAISNLSMLLNPRGLLVASVPHTDDSVRYVPSRERGCNAVQIQRQIGHTGTMGAMWHYSAWLRPILPCLPKEYVAICDPVANSSGTPKRLHYLFCPRGVQALAAAKNLKRLGLTTEQPQIIAKMATALSDDVRAIVTHYEVGSN